MLAAIFGSAATIGATTRITVDYAATAASGRFLDVRGVRGSLSIAAGSRLELHAVADRLRTDAAGLSLRAGKTPGGLLVCFRYRSAGQPCDGRSRHAMAGLDPGVVGASVNVAV